MSAVAANCKRKMHNTIQNLTVEVLAVMLASGAGWLDWRSRRIPNWLTVPALALGIALSTLAWGWPGTKAALEGAGLGLGLLLPFVVVRGLGAGDWKLMGALGAFLGPSRLVAVLLGTVFIAGIMAVAQMLRSRRLVQTLRNVWILILSFITFGWRGQREQITLDNPGLMSLPFGVAATLSTVLFFGTLSALRILKS
jgi:prepilin peptidase CpaA